MSGKYTQDDALERIWIFIDMINDQVLKHQYIESNQSMQHKIVTAMYLLMDVYQEIENARVESV